MLIVAALMLLTAATIYSAQQPRLIVNNKSYNLLVADSDSERMQGLSGKSQLAADEAMAFIYDSSDRRCFWMKDMQFNIDIAWLDSNKKVTATEHNVAPETYPHEFCHNAQYVIEFNAGEMKMLGVKTGNSVAIQP